MKELRISLTDEEYNELKKLKGKMTWKEFIVNLARDNRKKVIRKCIDELKRVTGLTYSLEHLIPIMIHAMNTSTIKKKDLEEFLANKLSEIVNELGDRR